KDAEAEELYQRSLAIEEKILDKDHPDVAETCYRLADLYRAQQRYAEAEPLYQRAMAILDLHAEPGGGSGRWMRNGYAEYLRETKRETEAEQLERQWGEWNAFEESLRAEVQKREAVLGPDHPDLADSLQNLANTCLWEGNSVEAE